MLRTTSNSRAGNHLPAFLFREICRKTYWPKHLPPCAPQQFFLGVPLRVGLSRSIFPGAGKRSISNHSATRAQKGYLRISLTRPASCIAPTSPAITSAQHVRSARAPGSGAHSRPAKTYCPKDQPPRAYSTQQHADRLRLSNSWSRSGAIGALLL